MLHRFDVIGDVHGQLGALRGLGRHLGYDVDDGWTHPDGRVLVFVGDLVDRGADSLGVAELVLSLAQADRAVCLMGNHEYNLVGFKLGLESERHSNRVTIADLRTRSDRWAPVLDFMQSLPLAIELPEVRIIHAVWHLPCIEGLGAIRRKASAAPDATTGDWLRGHVVLGSPFDATGLVAGLPVGPAVPPGDDSAHEALLKGYEAVAQKAFIDSDGKERNRIRVPWWIGAQPEIPTDRVTVFGHYWNLPPVRGGHDKFAPPFPSGHPDLKKWQREIVDRVPARGIVDVPAGETSVCIDYNGVFDAKGGSCVGAFRWPERQVAWARVGV